MPTAEFPVGAQTRDIFRTIDGVNLNIGPHDRLRAGAVGDFSNQAPLISVTPAAYPRIVLRDSLGYELDTYTTLQEAIYRAKWNVRTTGQSKTPLEWRLPKAPPPARPDLTRTFPPVKHPQLAGGYGKTSGITGNILEIDVDDVSFVKESLDRLPYAPSLSFLRQEILVGPKTYFQIVGTMLLHKRLLSETEKRHAIYNFPGFCSGCIRMGLCYGCERSSEPHYHEDKLVKTGGGFTYYKKDRPEREMKHKNPINWKINHPDQVLKRLMEDYAGVHLDGDVSTKVKEHLDTRTDRRTRHVSEDRDAMDIEYLDRNRSRGDDGRFLPNIDPRYMTEQQRDSALLGYATPGQGQGQSRGQSVDPSIDPSDVDIDMFEQEQGQRKVLSKRSTKTDLNDESKHGEDEKHSGEINGYAQNSTHCKGDKSNRDDSDTRYNDYERYEHRLPKYRKTESEEDSDSEGKRDYEGDDESRGRKRDRLYKPPHPFKVKRSPKRRIEAKSPFSTDRSYDIPKGQDFVPRKSNKKPTEFVNFRDVDVSWKEPKKFELKKANHKTTNFWSGARTKKKEKSRSRSPKSRRPPSPRSPSPDSGLDTGFMTESDVEVAIHEQHSDLESDDVQRSSKKGPRGKHNHSGTLGGVSNERNNSEREPFKTKRSVQKHISNTVHLTDGMITSSAAVSSTRKIPKTYIRQNLSPSRDETDYHTSITRDQSLLFPEFVSEDMNKKSSYPQAEEKIVHGLTRSSIEMSKTRSLQKFAKAKKETKNIDSPPRGKHVNSDRTIKVSSLKTRSDIKDISYEEKDFRNLQIIQNSDGTNTSNSIHNVSKETENNVNNHSSNEKIKLPKMKLPSHETNIGRRKEAEHFSLPKLQQNLQNSSVLGSRGIGNYREIVHFPHIAPRQGYMSEAVESESDDSVIVNQITNSDDKVVGFSQQKQNHTQRSFEDPKLSKKEEKYIETIGGNQNDHFENGLCTSGEFNDLKNEISVENSNNSNAYVLRKVKRTTGFETTRNQKQISKQDSYKSKDDFAPLTKAGKSPSMSDKHLRVENGISRERIVSRTYNIESCDSPESGNVGKIDLKNKKQTTNDKKMSTHKRTTHYIEFGSQGNLGDTFTDSIVVFNNEARISKQRKLNRIKAYVDKKDFLQSNDNLSEITDREIFNESKYPVNNFRNQKHNKELPKTRRRKPNYQIFEIHNESLIQRSSSNNSLIEEKPDDSGTKTISNSSHRGDVRVKEIERNFNSGPYTGSFEGTKTNGSRDINSNKGKTKNTAREDLNESRYPVNSFKKRKRNKERTKTSRLKPNYQISEIHNESLTQRSSSNNSPIKEKPDDSGTKTISNSSHRGEIKVKEIERNFNSGPYTGSFEGTNTNGSRDINTNKGKTKDTAREDLNESRYPVNNFKNRKRNKKRTKTRRLKPNNKISEIHNESLTERPSSNNSLIKENTDNSGTKTILDSNQRGVDKLIEIERNFTNDPYTESFEDTYKTGGQDINTNKGKTKDTAIAIDLKNMEFCNLDMKQMQAVKKRIPKRFFPINKQTDSGIFNSDEKNNHIDESEHDVTDRNYRTLNNGMEAKNDDGLGCFTNNCYDEIGHDKYTGGCGENLRPLHHSADLMCVRDNHSDVNVFNKGGNEDDPDDGNIGDDEYDNQSDTGSLTWDNIDEYGNFNSYNPESDRQEIREIYSTQKELNQIPINTGRFSSSDMDKSTTEFEDENTDTEPKSYISNKGKTLEERYRSIDLSKTSHKRHENMSHRHEKQRDDCTFSDTSASDSEFDDGSSITEYKPNIDDNEMAKVEYKTKKENQHGGKMYRKPRKLIDALTSKKSIVSLPHTVEMSFPEQYTDTSSSEKAAEDGLINFQNTGPFGNEQILSNKKRTIILRQNDTDKFEAFEHNGERLDQNIGLSGHKTVDKLTKCSTISIAQDKEINFHSTYTYSDVTISDTDEKDDNLRKNSDKEDEKKGKKKYEKHSRLENELFIKAGYDERKQRFQRNIVGDNNRDDSSPGKTRLNDSSSKRGRDRDNTKDKTSNPLFESTKYDKYLQRGCDLVNMEQIEGNVEKEKKLEKSDETTNERPTSRFDNRSFKSYDITPEMPRTFIYRDQGSNSVVDTFEDSETQYLPSYTDQNNEDGVKIVARRGRCTYRKHGAENEDLTLTTTPDSLYHRTEVDEHCKIHRHGDDQGDIRDRDVKEYSADGLKPAKQQHYRQNSRVHYLRRAYSNSDVLVEKELRKRTLQNQYIRAGRTQSEDILEEYRKRSNSDDVTLQTSGMTKIFESDLKFKGYSGNMYYSKQTRRTLSSSDTLSQKEFQTVSLNIEDGIASNKEDLGDEAKEKRKSTTSVRTISIDMTSLSPHLHMVEPDSSSLSGESVSPPLIPNNVAFDVHSVTSEEPELDLEFNHVIDVTNIEEDDTAIGIESSQLIEEKKRKRHRHKRRRRKADRITKDADLNAEQVRNMFLPNEEKEVEITGNDNTQQECEYDGVDDKVFFEAVKKIDDETRQFNTPSHRSEKGSASFDTEVITEDKEVFHQDDSDRNMDPEMSQRYDMGSTIFHGHNHFNHHIDRKVISDSDRSEKANDGNEIDTNKFGDVEENTVVYHVVDSNKKGEQKKLRCEKKKAKTRRKNFEDYEIDFAALPSIETQVAKIMYNYNYDDQANTALSSRSSCRSSRRHSIATPNIARQRLFRSRSVSKGSRSRRSSTKRTLKKKRSKSLPNTNELIAMKDQFDANSNGASTEYISVPVYLGSFPSRIAKKQFKTTLDRKRVQGRGRSMSLFITDEDATNKSELEPLREESQVIDTAEMDRVLTPSTTRIPTPASTNSLLSNGSLSNTNTSFTKPPSTLCEGHKQSLVVGDDSCSKLRKEPPKSPLKREIIKKERRAKTPVPAPVRSPSPVEEPPNVSPTPEPVEDDGPVSREISFEFIREPPELPPIEVPELPIIPESQPTEYKGIKREKKLIEVSPELPAQKKKFPPPPKPRPQIRSRAPSRKTKVAEAPVTTQELQQMIDPLDFLAKYCIINPDRLPFYERVFNGALSVQTPRYNRGTEAPKGAIVHLPPAQLSDHELNMLKDITVLNQGHCPRNDGISAPEQYLEKLNYSIEFIKSKQDVIQSHMEKVQAEKMQFMAGMAKKWDRDIVRLDYKTKIKKKKKKKKKKKGEEPDYDQMGALSDKTNFQPMKMSDITDEVIVSRMDDKMMKKIKKDPVYLKYKMEIGRDIEKLKHHDERVAQIEDEKDLVGLYCMDYYFSEQGALNRPQEFRRQQSRLYQKLHPDPDIEMNIEEVEPALQQINNKLLTQREFQYIYFILDLPRREKINFRLFSIVAALSEKVTQMDPVIRKLINKVDYNALDVKLEKSKELFQLLQDERVLPHGNAPSDNLAVELTAGGLTPEHTTYVMNKFDREGRGFIDFLDFVTYVPLFIEIHSRIIDDPFNDTLCV